MHDEIVSLGYNCEVGFQTRRWYGETFNGFFRWRTCDIDAIVRLIDNSFDNVLELDAIGPGVNEDMLRDNNYGFEFHKVDDLANEREKMLALGRRFMRPAGSRLYLLKPRHEDVTDEKLARLADALNKIDPNYDLVLLVAPESPRPNVLPERFHIRPLDFFAPEHAADTGHEEGYDRVFEEFPIALQQEPLDEEACPPKARLRSFLKKLTGL